MPVPLFIVDAFADRPFSGNPAAVCLLASPAEASWMQLVAREMNLSETAFLVPRDGGDYDLRWFTPKVEVDLCGHATLASAHVLWETGRLDAKSAARFHTRSGLLTATRNDGASERRLARSTPGASGLVLLDLPAHPAQESPLPEGIHQALGTPVAWVGRSRFDVLVELPTEAAVRALAPDLAALAKVEGRGFIVTARGSGTYDFVSRFFAPRVGVAEDPVTGSAHCVLGPYWASRLGKRELTGYQASERGGVVHVSLNGERVTLGGRGVTVARGELVRAPGEG
jgi:PhzF family phenazine biosynthesis protein